MVAMQGLTFELNTPHGRMMTTLLAGIAQFERDLTLTSVSLTHPNMQLRGAPASDDDLALTPLRPVRVILGVRRRGLKSTLLSYMSSLSPMIG